MAKSYKQYDRIMFNIQTYAFDMEISFLNICVTSYGLQVAGQ